MKQFAPIAFVLALTVASTHAQTAPANQTPKTPAQAPVAQPRQQTMDLAEYGVDFQVDTRLIVVMAALDAAGFDPTPTGREPSNFRARLRRNQAELDPDLRSRLRTFYERNRLPSPATPAEQASRYVSLALAMGSVPALDSPERSDDLPAGLLEVLDFAPLVREFYRRSGIDGQLVPYVREYQGEEDRLRAPAAEMVRALLTYLHTRPITASGERVEVKNPKSNSKTKAYTFRTKERRFFIIPDLLAPRGAVNFRIIGDDYYAIVPEGTDPSSSELRRAYLQYVIDALVLRFNKEIALRREPIKQLLDERQKANGQVSPDVFLTVSRSLVAAADARYDELRKLETVSRTMRSRLAAGKTDAEKVAIGKAIQSEISAVQDDTVARLADEYEKGAVLSFFFADQLKGIETAGFDVANFFPDMMTSFDPVREAKRPAEYNDARQRSLAAREARAASRKAELEANEAAAANAPREAALVKELASVEDTLRRKNYNDAETQLREMLKNYPREPRIFFALGQSASLAAMDATDEQVQSERLNRALGHYRLAVQASSPDSDKAIMSRAHESMGRINAFLENKSEAEKEFDEAIKLGDVAGGAYKQALEGKKKLAQP